MQKGSAIVILKTGELLKYLVAWTSRRKRESKFFSLTVDCCSMSQQGGGLEMGKMIEEQHVQVLQHGDEDDDDDDNDEYEDDRRGASPGFSK